MLGAMARPDPFPTGARPSEPGVADVVFLCTGNATRSVLAEALVREQRPDLAVSSAGTLVIEGTPLSPRTRAAFEAIGVEAPPHRSRQATVGLLEPAAVVVGFEPHHVEWVRREHPALAARTATLPRLHRHLGARGSLRERIAAMQLADVELEPWEEVVDPGGLEIEAFVDCARQVQRLTQELADRW